MAGEAGAGGGAAPVADSGGQNVDTKKNVSTSVPGGNTNQKVGDNTKKGGESKTPFSDIADRTLGRTKDTEPKADAKADGQPEKPSRKKYKVYGEEVEVDPERADEYIQKGLAFEKKSGKLSEMEKKFSTFEQAVAKGDRGAIRKMLGDDRFRQFAIEEINELIELEEMSPQERAHRDRERQLQEREAKIRQAEEAERQEFERKLDDHYTKKFDEEFTQAVEKTGLPKHPKVMHRMAQLMQLNLDEGLEVSTDSIAKLVRSEMMGDVKSLVGALDGQQLAELLGDEVTQRVRQYDVSRLRSPMSNNRVAGAKAQDGQGQERKPFESPRDDRVSMDEWKARLERIKSGK